MTRGDFQGGWKSLSDLKFRGWGVRGVLNLRLTFRRGLLKFWPHFLGGYQNLDFRGGALIFIWPCRSKTPTPNGKF